jgi:hypothetical protein
MRSVHSSLWTPRRTRNGHANKEKLEYSDAAHHLLAAACLRQLIVRCPRVDAHHLVCPKVKKNLFCTITHG